MSSNLSHIHFLTISIGFSVLGILPSFNQSVSWAVFSCGNSNREESSLKLIQVFGRICLPVVVWLRALVSYWLLTGGHPQVLETTSGLPCGPFQVSTSCMAICFLFVEMMDCLMRRPWIIQLWLWWKCGEFWKRWEYQTTWPASWEICMKVRKQQLELDMEQQIGSK